MYNGSQHYGGRKMRESCGKPTTIQRQLPHLLRYVGRRSEHLVDLTLVRVQRKYSVRNKAREATTVKYLATVNR